MRLSWVGLLNRPDCADKIRVKYWNSYNPNGYVMSDKLSVETISHVVDRLDKYVEYTFQVKEMVVVECMVTTLMLQVIAVEEKSFGRMAYYKSPVVKFKTSKEKKVGLGMLVAVASSFRLNNGNHYLPLCHHRSSYNTKSL